jgi:hypothetical protein
LLLNASNAFRLPPESMLGEIKNSIVKSRVDIVGKNHHSRLRINIFLKRLFTIQKLSLKGDREKNFFVLTRVQ